MKQVSRETMGAKDRANTLEENLRHRVLIPTNIEAREAGKAADEIFTLDEMLRQRVIMTTNIEAAVDELHEIMDHSCRSSFRKAGQRGNIPKHKSLPWWTSRFSTQRKEVNTKRRRYL